MLNEPPLNLEKTSQVPVAVWHHSKPGKTYAFPLSKSGASFSQYGFPSPPALNQSDWQYMGTLPAGMPLADVAKHGEMYTCKIAGISVVTYWTVVLQSSAS